MVQHERRSVAPTLLDHLPNRQPLQAVRPLELLQAVDGRTNSVGVRSPERDQLHHRVLVLRDHESLALLHALQQPAADTSSLRIHPYGGLVTEPPLRPPPGRPG